MGFITTNDDLPVVKADLTTRPSSVPANKWFASDDYNKMRAALYEVRDAINNGRFGAHVFSSNFAGADLGARINAADAFLGAVHGTIEVPVSDVSNVATRIALSANRTLILRRGTYTATTPGVWLSYQDNTHIMGDGWGTILQESTDTSLGSEASLVIAQNANNLLNNFADGATNVIFENLTMKGANVNFGSAAQALGIGNSHNVVVDRVHFDSTRAEGIGVGTASNSGFYATNIWITRCLFEHVASQNIGAVNVSGIHIVGNTFRAGGQVGGPGCTYIDFEPNGFDDRIEHFEIVGNLIDSRGSANPGNGIVVQDGSGRPNIGPGTIANNTIMGGWNAGDIGAGIDLIQMHEVNVVGNTLRRLNGGINLGGGCSRCSVKGNHLTATGGGGIRSISVEGTYNVVSDNDLFMTADTLNGSQDATIVEQVGSDFNIIKNNYLDYVYEQAVDAGAQHVPGGYVLIVGAHTVAHNNSHAGRKVDRSAQHFNVRTVAASDAIGIRDHYIFVDTTAGDVTLSIPAYETANLLNPLTETECAGRQLIFKRVAGAGNIIVVPGGTDTIDGAPNLTISDNNTHQIMSDGTIWRAV